MNLSDFYSPAAQTDSFVFTRAQGSQFAKTIAGDFNPLHDVDAKKFCVPGDLLFTLSLAKLGVSEKMKFDFSGMVSEDVELQFDAQNSNHIKVVDDQEKQYLSIEREGEKSTNEQFANLLAQRYVAFSGYTFPHILVPLMAEKEVMINPARPMVIYQSMSIEMQRLDVADLSLEMTGSTLEVEGKRGTALLKFCFKAADEIVGYGEKTMILSGLRAFDQTVIDTLVSDYETRKNAG
jgi:hypothetical protein